MFHIVLSFVICPLPFLQHLAGVEVKRLEGGRGWGYPMAIFMSRG
jgi:hypothetical protein